MRQIIHYYYTSNIGRCRKTNQDNFYFDGASMPAENRGTDGIIYGNVTPAEDPVFAVFDGMGGEEHGEMAAYIATQEMRKHTFHKDMEGDYQAFCQDANHSICVYTQENNISSMGTTAAMLRFSKNESGVCNIGDSKIYLYAENTLTQLSYDHVGIAVYGRKPPLTQNLGIPEDELVIDPYIAIGSYKPGDTYLLCSDGLTDMVKTERIEEILNNYKGRRAAELLLSEALENGGRDNITFFLVYVEKKPGLFGKKKEVEKWL